MQAGRVEEPTKYPDQQPPISASWDNAISVSSQRATVTVEGDFLMAFWGATLDVEHAGGQETWVSGRHNERSVDPDGNVVVADETWIYLDVSGGRLTIPAREVPEGSLIAASEGGRLSVDGSLQARGAEGELLGHVLHHEDVTVSGALEADGITARGDRLSFQLTGDPDRMVLGGGFVAVAEGGGPSLLWAFLLAPLVVAGAVWRQRPAARIARLRDSLGRGRFSGVARRGPRFFGTRWDTPARIATTVALLRLDAPDAALEVVSGGDVPVGTAAFLRAHANALMGREPEARAHLQQALEAASHLRLEAERNPALAPLLVGGTSVGGYA